MTSTDRTHEPSQDHRGTERPNNSPISDAEVSKTVTELRAWPGKPDALNHRAASLLTRLQEDKTRAEAEARRSRTAELAWEKHCKEAEADFSALKTRVAEVLEPIAKFSAALDAKPLRGVDDEFYGIHTGTEWQASLRFSDFRRAAELHSEITGKDRP